ncbi:OTUlike cysteine protease domain containing protein [Acanthamoeba castellanii str. Neff]|uniref:ubiquitinyl hydrolase 1 n=1 Tax=Acanthamoeba castellanii (strain ATCC 30010 / Neff) TaxID=1257118 RepID=L8GNC5_ACACF|nr:OTUlike cysteine protease domain containing protein [Acanthamoeba castellanii str. Neff]ELR14487.1 OTUlike cysteine protease domain containing protein [Acanthamoeba castellanii str. Neff]
MNDVVVRVLVPLDPNAASSSSKVAKTAAPAGYEEVQETLPGIFSLKVGRPERIRKEVKGAARVIGPERQGKRSQVVDVQLVLCSEAQYGALAIHHVPDPLSHRDMPQLLLTRGGWYDDEDEWEKPQQASGFPAFSAPPGYQMSEEEQLQAAMMLSRVAADEDADKEQDFEGLMLSKGLMIKKISDDGNCLFGAVADQAYADPALHAELRKQCLDYMEKDRDHFSQFVTEDFEAYVLRKRCLGVYANNPEIQALSEMLGRPIEVYSYASEPMNTFQGAGGGGARPIRISYHRGNHYNSLRSLDPTTEEAPLPALAPSGAAAATTVQPPQATPAGEGENACFLCGQQCVDYEDLQIHMFTTCEKKDLL